MEQASTATVIRPDDLLTGIGRSIMSKAIVYSILGHLVLTLATSVPLFLDWRVYGVKSPSAINAIKTEENRKLEEEARRKKAEEKAEAEAKAEAEKKAQAAEKGPKAAAGAAGAAATNATVGADEKKTPPEVQPLPPKKDIGLGDELSLD